MNIRGNASIDVRGGGGGGGGVGPPHMGRELRAGFPLPPRRHGTRDDLMALERMGSGDWRGGPPAAGGSRGDERDQGNLRKRGRAGEEGPFGGEVENKRPRR